MGLYGVATAVQVVVYASNCSDGQRSSRQLLRLLPSVVFYVTVPVYRNDRLLGLWV